MGKYDKLYKEFLSKFRKARTEAGLTQKQVAELLHKPQSYVSKSESGERRIDVVELTEFARIYNKPLDYFVEIDKGIPGQ
jgi:transcriptional regulator with XRE-family HTH domain